MHRTYRYPLRPTQAQEAVLESWLIACQQLYNGALQGRVDAWKRAKVSVSLYDQQVELTQLRASDEAWRTIPVWVARSALQRIDRAFNAFFRRIKTGEKPGFPRYKPQSQYSSFGIGYARAKHGYVLIPKLGPVKFHEYRPMKGKIKNVEIKKECGKWFVLFQCDVGEAPAKVAVTSSVGIDLGLTTFATLSNGDEIKHSRHYRNGQELLAKRQQSLAKKTSGSANRKDAKLLVAKAHRHIANQRLDFQRKVACELFAEYDLIAHEDLDIRSMVSGANARTNLAKSIHDAAWGQFIGILACKAESAGKHLIPVNPRGTSQRCSACGATVSKTLAEREHRCECGLVLGRDHNAAINVLMLAPAACGIGECR